MPDAPLIRPAVAGDVPALLDMIHAAYRGRGGWTTEADVLDGPRTDVDLLAADLADPAVALLLAETDEVLACCSVTVVDDATAAFGTFAVAPGRQGGGLGGRMLAEAEALAAGWGATTMEMCVLAQRADLIAWYVRRGYAPTGESRPFPYGDERYGWPRRDDLVFSVLTKTLARP